MKRKKNLKVHESPQILDDNMIYTSIGPNNIGKAWMRNFLKEKTNKHFKIIFMQCQVFPALEINWF